jgi:hypothetical protein
MAEPWRALAERVATTLRPADGSVIDPAAVAEALGVRVEIRPMAASVHGANPGPHWILANRSLPEPERRFVIAHELAHALVKQGAVSVDRSVEERFADAFAEVLLVPAVDLENGDDAVTIATRLGIPPAVVAARAERLGRLLSRSRVA